MLSQTRTNRLLVSIYTLHQYPVLFITVLSIKAMLCMLGHFNTLCTSGFVDDIMFFHNGPMNFAMKDHESKSSFYHLTKGERHK